MRKPGGSIVNVTSGAGSFGTFGQANHAAAKAGVIGPSRVMDLEPARHDIRVNTLAPVARTNMTAVFDTGPVTHRLPFPPPETVAPLVTCLASDASRHLEWSAGAGGHGGGR